MSRRSPWTPIFAGRSQKRSGALVVSAPTTGYWPQLVGAEIAVTPGAVELPAVVTLAGPTVTVAPGTLAFPTLSPSVVDGGTAAPASYGALVSAQGASSYWPLQIGRADTAVEADDIGAFDLTMTGGASVVGAAGPFGDGSVALVAGDTEGYVGSTYDSRQSWTISLWVKAAALSGNQVLAAIDQSATVYVYLLHRDDQGGLCVQIGDGSPAVFLDPGTVELDDSAWHHVALTRDYSATAADDTWTLYVDGAQVGQTTSFVLGITPAQTGSTGMFSVGNRPGTDIGPTADLAHAYLASGVVMSAERVATQAGYTIPSSGSCVDGGTAADTPNSIVDGADVLVQMQDAVRALGPDGWWDAANPDDITDVAGAVSAWVDKSGNGNDFEQGTSGERPTTGATTVNGRNVIDFDGTEWMEQANTTALRFMHDATEDTIFAVVVISNGEDRLHGIIGSSISASDTGWSVYVDDRSAAPAVDRLRNYVSRAGVGIIYANSGADSSMVMDAAAIAEFRTDPDNGTAANRSYGRVDGGTEFNTNTFGSGTPVTANSTYPVQVGALGNDTFPMVGSVCEIIAFDGVMTADERNTVRTYLATKWGITI